jgi:TRAP-type C4-dicarboxylate transport system permease small subunit
MLRFAFATLPRWVLGTLMLLGVAINFANVIGRYAFGHALFWAEEMMVFITIWGVFIGLAAITYDGDHLNMDLFSSAIRGPWRFVVNGFVAAAMIACCVFVVLQSYQVVTLFAQTNQVSVAAGVPKAIPHAALLTGFALAALAVVVRIRSYLTGKF